MLANTTTVRKFAKYFNNNKGFGYANSYTDKVVKDRNKEDNGLRYMAFRLYNATQADKLAKDLEFVLFTQGYTNKVIRTSSAMNWMERTTGGEYVRVIAKIGA